VTNKRTAADYDSPLDPGIAVAVIALNDANVETFESCEGGPGHAYPEPTVRFHGNQAEGLRALAVAMNAGLRVSALRRTWPILDEEPTGPWWELTFVLASDPIAAAVDAQLDPLKDELIAMGHKLAKDGDA
jgi:hypothetical protein